MSSNVKFTSNVTELGGIAIPANLRAYTDRPSDTPWTKIREVPVLVNVTNADLAQFSELVYESLNSQVTVDGGQMPITAEELKKYFATAIYARVQFSRRKLAKSTNGPSGYHAPRLDAEWGLPTPMNIVVGSIGRVVTQDNTTYVPDWNKKGNSLLLSADEWMTITMRLRSLQRYGIHIVRALSREDSGDERVMRMLWFRIQDRTFALSSLPVHPLAALVGRIAGLSEDQEVDIEGLHPEMIPGYQMDGEYIVSFVTEFATIAS